MPNKNYCKGRRKEYSIIEKEKSKGFISFRSAGSHSPIDVVSIDIKNKVIYLIQSKPLSFSNAQKQKLLNQYKELNDMYAVVFNVI